MVKKVIDDGSNESYDDLTDVTERHLTYYEPRKTAPVGLPGVIEEKFLVIKNGWFGFSANEENSSKKQHAPIPLKVASWARSF